MFIQPRLFTQLKHSSRLIERFGKYQEKKLTAKQKAERMQQAEQRRQALLRHKVQACKAHRSRLEKYFSSRPEPELRSLVKKAPSAEQVVFPPKSKDEVDRLVQGWLEDPPSQILPHLLLGCYHNAWAVPQMREQKLAEMKGLGLTHVLVASSECQMAFAGEFKYLKIHIKDEPMAASRMREQLAKALAFIAQAQQEQGVVLVHCMMGISRSSTIVLAYLMTQGMSLKDAYAHVKRVRPCIKPNPGWLAQIRS
eukprot:g75160.t1